MFNTSGTATNPQTKALWTAFYANLGSGQQRRDIQHHTSIGAIIPVGAATNTVWSDLFKASGLAVTAGSGFALNVAAGVIQSRFYGAQLAASAQVVTPQVPSVFDRTDLLIIGPNGVVSVIPGDSGKAAATYEVDTLTIAGTVTGGTLALSFMYNGFNYTTAAIATNGSTTPTAATVATAVLAATGGPALPASTLTGSGGPFSTPIVLTASGALEGALTRQAINTSLTTGTVGATTYVQSTAGVGGGAPVPSGGYLPLAQVYVPSTATSSSNYTITSVALTS